VVYLSTDLAFEGDLDGLGNVQVIQYHYDDGSTWTGAGPNPCPCIRRSSVPKIAANPWNQGAPIFYTEIQNLVPPTANTPIFSAYQASGLPVGNPGPPVVLPAGTLSTTGGQPTCTSSPCTYVLGNDTAGVILNNHQRLQQIKTIRINLTTQGVQKDFTTGQSIQVNMVGSARLPNNN
jgi:hypothetical protein